MKGLTDKYSIVRISAYIGLFLSCLVPVAAGIYRSTTLILEWEWNLVLLRDRSDNLPLFIHVVGAMVFLPSRCFSNYS